jgi:hypothetical protein
MLLMGDKKLKQVFGHPYEIGEAKRSVIIQAHVYECGMLHSPRLQVIIKRTPEKFVGRGTKSR